MIPRDPGTVMTALRVPHHRTGLTAFAAILALVVARLPVAAAETAAAPTTRFIREIALVHFSHTDVGFTDSPSVCRELYRRYLDLAIDAVLDSRPGPEDARFSWTAEATMPVRDWWEAATTERRNRFLEAVASGQLEISALPFNNTPFLDAGQWDAALHWLPGEIWNQVKPTVAIQDDVNGVPRAAARALLDRGIHRLFTGINEDSGGVPFPRPSAFWWRQPDGRRMFVWLNAGYGSGFDLFEPAEWRRGPVPSAADTRYRPPRPGEILSPEESSVRRAHRQCVEHLRRIEAGGYRHELLTISITSQWRFDNDPPFPPMADFVASWNRLGLEPRLRLTTVGEAMRRMEAIAGPTAPEHAGEWTDWWANGTASAPREVAASRVAKRLLVSARSPIWGPVDDPLRRAMEPLYQDLCLFDEHTWGSSLSVARPWSLDTQAQFTEKSLLAYRPMARAEWLLSQRARSRLVRAEEGLHLANPSPALFSGWVRMIATALRTPSRSLEDAATGERLGLEFQPGIQPWGRPRSPADLSPEDVSATFPDRAPDQAVRFWVERLDGQSIRRFRFSTNAAPAGVRPATGPELRTDASGWPVAATWPGMKQPLFLGGFGELSAIRVDAFAPRHVLADIRGQSGEARERLRREKLIETVATAAGPAEVADGSHTRTFSQALAHPRLAWGTRVLEVWKREPRARLVLRINRSSSAAPEILYVNFPLPAGDTLPRLSNGGLPFTPFTDQLPGTCRDYFAIDGWADYVTPAGRWLWVSRDAPLISFGASPTLARLTAPPPEVHRLRAMIFNNFWYTNFAADEHGIMEFQFDLVWRPDAATPAAELAEALTLEPVVVINPAAREDERVIRHLFQP